MSFIPDDPHCESTRAALVLSGVELDPRQVSDRLGLDPTSAYISGATTGVGTGSLDRRPRSWPAEVGLWILATTTPDQPAATRKAHKSLEWHLQALLEIIEPAAPAIRAIAPECEKAEVACTWMSSYELGAGPRLTPSTMSRLAALGLPLVVEFFA